ncbi:MAG TPA: hypothetical protein VL400_18385 [Polyangiaceae bacterium]|jgi:hypothetical protein|nr:hypothetical protein [Polyangiaceae bacterium]
MHRHPKVSAWQREEDGSYKRELGGYELHVSWRPEAPDVRRGFSWTVKPPEGDKVESEDVAEEIEHAMLDAEDAARVAGALDEG